MQRPEAVVAFWRDAGPSRWFKKDPAFDRAFRERFLAEHEAAARGWLHDWEADAQGSLALLILLDQFPRNAFRDTPRMFATDGAALDVARRAVGAGHDLHVAEELRNFFYLPFMHSENLADQDRAVELTANLSGDEARFARVHRDIIARFGRFPHRNTVLGRMTTDSEQAFLAGGGFKG